MSSLIFFVGAAVVLAASSWGILTVPGLFFAVAGIALSLRRQNGYAAICGYIPAVGSFLAQSVVGVCSSCTLAACLFTGAAITSSVNITKQKPEIDLYAGKVAVGVVVLILSILVFIIQMPDHNADYSLPAKAVSIVSIKEQVQSDEKMLYFFSPSCSHCELALRALCEIDPEGEHWTPVIVPQIETYGGEKMLRRHGYKGKFETSWESPSGSFPCLVLDGQVVTGDKKVLEGVKNHFK